MGPWGAGSLEVQFLQKTDSLLPKQVMPRSSTEAGRAMMSERVMRVLLNLWMHSRRQGATERV